MRGDFVQELAKLPKTEIQQLEGDPASIRVKLEQFAAPELRPSFGGKIGRYQGKYMKGVISDNLAMKFCKNLHRI